MIPNVHPAFAHLIRTTLGFVTFSLAYPSRHISARPFPARAAPSHVRIVLTSTTARNSDRGSALPLRTTCGPRRTSHRRPPRCAIITLTTAVPPTLVPRPASPASPPRATTKRRRRCSSTPMKVGKAGYNVLVIEGCVFSLSWAGKDRIGRYRLTLGGLVQVGTHRPPPKRAPPHQSRLPRSSCRRAVRFDGGRGNAGPTPSTVPECA